MVQSLAGKKGAGQLFHSFISPERGDRARGPGPSVGRKTYETEEGKNERAKKDELQIEQGGRLAQWRRKQRPVGTFLIRRRERETNKVLQMSLGSSTRKAVEGEKEGQRAGLQKET